MIPNAIYKLGLSNGSKTRPDQTDWPEAQRVNPKLMIGQVQVLLWENWIFGSDSRLRA